MTQRSPSDPRIVSVNVSRCAAMGVALTGGAVLAGWIINNPVLMSVIPGLTTMKPNTALCFVLLGASLYLRGSARGGVWRPRLAQVFAAFVGVLGLLTLSEYIFGCDLGIDQVLFKGSPNDLNVWYPGRMPPATAIGLLLLAGSLLMPGSRVCQAALAHALSVAVGAMGLFVCVGYVYGVPAIYEIGPCKSMALHATLCFMVLSAGVISACPDRGIMRLISSPAPIATVARRLLPAAIVLPLVTGGISLWGERAGHYGTEFGLAIFMMSNVIVFVGLIWLNGGLLIRADAERRRADLTRQQREERYRSLVIATSQIVWASSAEGQVLEDSASWRDYTGQSLEDFLGWGWSAAVHPDDRDRFVQGWRQAVETKSPYQIECRVRAVDGHYNTFLVRSVPVRNEDASVREWVGTCTDISAQIQMETQLRQSQKMEAIGRLAGGIAHDFNNLLTVIGGRSQLLLMKGCTTDWWRPNVEEIAGAAQMAAALTRQLLAFSRKQVLEPKNLDLNSVVAGTETMLRRLIGENIRLTSALDPALGVVKVDPCQIEQVILNLVVNARDAMPEGGTLTVETSNVGLDDSYTRRHPVVRPGPYVMLAVSDTGRGMDAETQASIFEPFFTTKGLGKGTGLGLSTVYGVVKQSNGFIWVYGEPGHGTTFKVYLPRVHGLAEPLRPVAPSTQRPHGSETILLVEDEKGVRELAKEILKAIGYTVLEAACGSDAVRIYEEYTGTIHLTITDVIMPGMSCRELTQCLRARRPATRILYVSGYTDEAIAHHGVLEPGTALVQKPFTADSLAAKMREVLDAQHGSAKGGTAGGA